jgi:hypothetical protein
MVNITGQYLEQSYKNPDIVSESTSINRKAVWQILYEEQKGKMQSVQHNDKGVLLL